MKEGSKRKLTKKLNEENLRDYLENLNDTSDTENEKDNELEIILLISISFFVIMFFIYLSVN